MHKIVSQRSMSKAFYFAVVLYFCDNESLISQTAEKICRITKLYSFTYIAVIWYSGFWWIIGRRVGAVWLNSTSCQIQHGGRLTDWKWLHRNGTRPLIAIAKIIGLSEDRRSVSRFGAKNRLLHFTDLYPNFPGEGRWGWKV